MGRKNVLLVVLLVCAAFELDFVDTGSGVLKGETDTLWVDDGGLLV